MCVGRAVNFFPAQGWRLAEPWVQIDGTAVAARLLTFPRHGTGRCRAVVWEPMGHAKAPFVRIFGPRVRGLV
jgi:hypothetical protein